MKKPWNLVNQPVYSLSTNGVNGFNMNIVTYATPVTMRPKRFVVAVYEKTLSLENLQVSETAVLQLMHEQQYPLVRALGKKSGKHFDKIAFLTKKKSVTNWMQHSVLKEAVAWILMKKIGMQPAGDHTLFLMEVIKHRTNSSSDYLSLDTLRKHQIISI